MKRILPMLVLLGTFWMVFRPTVAQTVSPEAMRPKSAIPDQFRSLYQELDETLRQQRELYPFKNGRTCPMVSPGLFMAGSGFGPAAPDSQRWQDLVATLDAFKTLGMNAVSVMIAAPDLSLSDPKPLIGFYQRLAAAIHSRGMKLYIEHFDNPPFSPHAHKGYPDTQQGKQDFLRMRKNELTLIYRNIKPDYLSLITEPETMARWSHLSFSTDELTNWVGEVAKSLKHTEHNPNILLGAGAGIWEGEDFVLKAARQPDLDYMDIHFFALKLNGRDMVATLADRIHKVRQMRPQMKITIGETWLYKHGADEPGGMLNRDAYFRDNFSFWSPLDGDFLKLMLGIARKENISVVAPYFSQYFFTYYTFGDADSNRPPPWPGSILWSWNKSMESIRNQALSPTGEAVRTTLRGCSN
jgi:hypothetical protein